MELAANTSQPPLDTQESTTTPTLDFGLDMSDWHLLIVHKTEAFAPNSLKNYLINRTQLAERWDNFQINSDFKRFQATSDWEKASEDTDVEFHTFLIRYMNVENSKENDNSVTPGRGSALL